MRCIICDGLFPLNEGIMKYDKKVQGHVCEDCENAWKGAFGYYNDDELEGLALLEDWDVEEPS